MAHTTHDRPRQPDLIITEHHHRMAVKSALQDLLHAAALEYVDLMRRYDGLSAYTSRQLKSQYRARLNRIRGMDQVVPGPEYFQRDRYRWARRLRSLERVLQGERDLGRDQDQVFDDEMRRCRHRIHQVRTQIHRHHTVARHTDAVFVPLRTGSLGAIPGMGQHQHEKAEHATRDSAGGGARARRRLNQVRDAPIGVGRPDGRRASLRALRRDQARLVSQLEREAAQCRLEQSVMSEQVRGIRDRHKQQLGSELEQNESDLRSNQVVIDTHDRALDQELLLTRAFHQRIADIESEHDRIVACVQDRVEEGGEHDPHQYEAQRIHRMMKARFGAILIRLHHHVAAFTSGLDRIKGVVICPRCHRSLRHPRFLIESLLFVCDQCSQAGGIDPIPCQQLDRFVTRVDLLNVETQRLGQMQRDVCARLYGAGPRGSD